MIALIVGTTLVVALALLLLVLALMSSDTEVASVLGLLTFVACVAAIALGLACEEILGDEPAKKPAVLEKTR